MRKNAQKVIVILGPTATGKSDLAVRLSKTFSGEVISADSRQVYTGLDIGSGKITEDDMGGVPHHMLNVASPKSSQKTFTVAQFQKMGQKIINEIFARGNVPIICGGSGFYIQALVDSMNFPEVLPNIKLRATLEKKSVNELCKILNKFDPRRFKEIDKKNPRRLIRAIEIAKALGKVPRIRNHIKKRGSYNTLFIGLNLQTEKLRKKINDRLAARLKQGMVSEVKRLRKSGLTWKRLEGFGLEYRAVARLLQKKINEQEMINGLQKDIWQYSKRQMRWFKRDKRVKWFEPKESTGIKNKVADFLRD